jgi:CelD/BcsL family acetyltransferase involved in cellulose biosynthesis
VHRALIRLGTDHDAFMASLGKNFRGNLRKARNRLRAAGESSLLCLREPGEMAAGLQRFAAVEAKSWKGRAGSTMGGTPRIMQLYERSLIDLATLGQSAVLVLTLNDEDIAAMIVHVSDSTLFAFKIGYDEQFAECSPGHLLIEAVIRDFCHARGITTMHLLTDERWFDSWRPERVQTYEVYLSERGLRGALSRWLGVPIRKRVKRMVQSYRDSKSSRAGAVTA